MRTYLVRLWDSPTKHFFILKTSVEITIYIYSYKQKYFKIVNFNFNLNAWQPIQSQQLLTQLVIDDVNDVTRMYVYIEYTFERSLSWSCCGSVFEPSRDPLHYLAVYCIVSSLASTMHASPGISCATTPPWWRGMNHLDPYDPPELKSPRSVERDHCVWWSIW